MKKNLFKASLMFLVALSTTHCNKSEFKASKKYKSQTYDSMSEEAGSVAQSAATHKITVAPHLQRQCVAGEGDLLELAAASGINADALLTIKDQAGEQVLFRAALSAAGANQGQNISNLVAGGSYEVTVKGDLVDVFLCVDHNRNGRCTDEPVKDLNDPAAGIAAVNGDVKRANGVGLDDGVKDGLVLYHTQYSFSAAADQRAQLAAALQDALKNLPPEIQRAGFDKQPGAGETVITIPIVKSEPTACNTSARTSGCFAKGTKVNVAKEKSMAIEKFTSGTSIYLADGRFARVKKVIAGPEKKPVITFQTAENQKITVTSEHPLLTNKGVKMAKDIAIGEELKTAQGEFTIITSISQKPYKDQVYNVELDGISEVDHLIVAEGLISGDLYLQNKLSKEATDIPKYLSAK